MKKVISFILILAMILSVSSFALAAGGYVTIEGDSTNTQYATIKDANDSKKGNIYNIHGKVTAGAGGFAGADNATFIGVENTGAEIDVSSTPQEQPYGSDLGSVTFKNLTFTTNDANYKGFHRAGKGIFENCTINGAYWTYAQEVYSKECTFIQDDPTGGAYCLWVYGGPTTTTVEDCTFYSTHKFILIYREGDERLDVSVTNSKFILENPVSKLEKSAIEMDASLTKNGIGLTATNNKVDTDISKDEDGKEKLYFDKAPGKEGTVTVTAAGNVVTKDFSDPVSVPEFPAPKSSGSGISVKYNGGNSFSTSNSAVPTGVEIDGVAVPFSGTGSNFTVGCVDPGAKWVTVRWKSTSVTTNFTPDGLVECSVSIRKTGDVSLWAAVLAFFGF